MLHSLLILRLDRSQSLEQTVVDRESRYHFIDRVTQTFEVSWAEMRFGLDLLFSPNLDCVTYQTEQLSKDLLALVDVLFLTFLHW